MNVLTKLWWGRCIGLLLVMLLALAQPLAFAAAGAPSGNEVQPTEVDGNPTCSVLMDEGTFAFEIRINDPVTGSSLTIDGVTITITDVRNTSLGQVFDWEAEGGVVNGVFVKGGPKGNLYLYNPPATSDTGLHAPINPNNGKYYGLSHVSFCVTPGVASIDVTKVCPAGGQTISGTVVTSRNTVTLLNDGDFLLNGIQIREDTSETCSLTKVDGAAVNVALPLNTYVTVPNGGSFDGNLAVDESVVLEVTCTDDELNVANTITGTGTASTGDVVDDTSTSNPADPGQCPLAPTPDVSIVKDCVDESDVRLMAMDGVLVAQVCPTIVVTNTSLTDPLTTAIVTDAQIPALAGGVDAIDEAGLEVLLPGESINLGDFVDLCYLPSAPEVAAFDESGTKYLPSHAGFLNEASVVASGFFGGVDPTDSDDTALRDENTDEILYLLDENGEPVLDANEDPIPLSECPLCAPCPDCPEPL
jgi:hypothetical protein